LTILVSYSEIALKSRYVRNQLEKSLSQDIINLLKKNGYMNSSTKRKFGRIYVNGIPNEAVNIVSKVFGVANAMPSYGTEHDFESVVEGIVEEAKRSLREGNSFAVRPRVIGNHEYNSQDVAYEAGSRVLDLLRDKSIVVNLDSPDVTLYVEVRDKDAYVYSSITRGVLGLPYGTQGKAVSLFSGGIDSPVATWLLMKRGVAVLPLFMDQRPLVGDSYVKRAKESFKQISSYVPRKSYKLYSAPMGNIMEKIIETSEPRFICIMCKRSMYRIAQQFAVNQKAKAIITGESLGQVASQTLNNLFVLSSSIDLPILRPLVGLDKVEIENIARNIGTYKITAKTTDGCTAVPKGPATRSKINVIEKLESELDLPTLCSETANRIKIISEES
jgi:thiamine biosynthesis protein ThiI